MNENSMHKKMVYCFITKETKSGVDLEMVNHSVKTEKELLDLIRKFKKVKEMMIRVQS